MPTNATTGYGGHQKTCYRLALAAGRDIVIMVHPGLSIHAKLILGDASIIANGLHPCVLAAAYYSAATRSQADARLEICGEPFFDGGGGKYFARRETSEYHTGYRAFSREILEKIDLSKNSDDFVFDNQMLRADFLARLHHCRGELPDESILPGILHQFPAQR